MRKLVLTLFTGLLIIGCSKDLPTYEAPSTIAFIPIGDAEYGALEAKLKLYHHGEDFSMSLDGAKQAFDESYILSDLIDQMQYSNDASVEAVIKQHIRGVFSGLSEIHFDEIRRRNIHGFVSTRYTAGVPYIWLFHTARAFQPILRYMALKGYRADSHQVKQIEEILKDFDSEWNGSTFVEPIHEYSELPYNMAGDVAIVYYYLYELTHNSKYNNYVHRILEKQRDGLFVTNLFGTSYLNWSYDPRGSRLEDSGHGLADLRIIEFFSTKGIVFSEEELLGVLSVYYNIVIRTDGSMSKYLDGSFETDETIKNTCMYSLSVYRYFPKWFEFCKQEVN